MSIRTLRLRSIVAVSLALLLGLLLLVGTIQGRGSDRRSSLQKTGSMGRPAAESDEPSDPPPPDEGELGTPIDWANISMVGADHPAEANPRVREAPPGNLPQPEPPPAAPQPAPDPGPSANETLPQGPPAPNESSQTTYVVQRGDTLHEIASRFGVPQNVLAAANNIVWVNWIYAGQELVIPGRDGDQIAQPAPNPPAEEGAVSGGAEPAAAAPASAPADGANTYIVQRGDSLGSISWKFGVDIGQLITENQLPNPNYIQAGQTLIIPDAIGAAAAAEEPPTETIAPAPTAPQVKAEPPLQAVANTNRGSNKYTVVFGDTLSIIAGRFRVAVIDLITANNLINPDYIYQSQELIIPQPGEQIAAAEEPAQEAAAEPVPEPVQETVEPAVELPADSKFIWPVETIDIINYYWAYHPGVDLVVDIGSNIFASAAGTVEFSGWNVNGYGYVVIIDHGGGVKTLYAHNSELLVAEGDQVGQGQLISLSGSTGYSTWPHVHFELIFEEYVRMNPCQYLPGGCS